MKIFIIYFFFLIVFSSIGYTQDTILFDFEKNEITIIIKNEKEKFSFVDSMKIIPISFDTAEVIVMGNTIDNINRIQIQKLNNNGKTTLIDKSENFKFSELGEISKVHELFIVAFNSEGKKLVDFKIKNSDNTNQVKLCDISEGLQFIDSKMLDEFNSIIEKKTSRIIFDFEKGKKIIQNVKKDGTLKTKKSIRVNNTLNIYFTGFSDVYEKLDFEYAFNNYFLEGRERFESTLEKFGKVDEGSSEEKKEEESSDLTNQKTKSDEKKLRDILNKLNEELQKYTDGVNIYYPPSNKVARDLKTIKANIENCSALKSMLGDSDLEENFPKIKNINKKLSFLENYHIYAPPFFQIPSADEMVLDISFTKDNNVDVRQFTIPVTRGWKLDFSSGLTWNQLVDERYSIEDADDTEDENGNVVEQKKIVQEDKNKDNLGFGIFAHVYPRISHRLNLAGTIGFNLDGDLATQLLLGGSLLLRVNRNQRIIISGGTATGKVDQLRDKYKNSPFNNTNGFPASDVQGVDSDQLVVSKRAWKPFISLTWNFASIPINIMVNKKSNNSEGSDD